MNELAQHRPVLLVQAGNVVSIEVGKVGFGHGNALPFLRGCSCLRVGKAKRAHHPLTTRKWWARRKVGLSPPYHLSPPPAWPAVDGQRYTRNETRFIGGEEQ